MKEKEYDNKYESLKNRMGVISKFNKDLKRKIDIAKKYSSNLE